MAFDYKFTDLNYSVGRCKYVMTAGIENGKRTTLQFTSRCKFSTSDFGESVINQMFTLTNLRHLDDSNFGDIVLYMYTLNT